jgi:hypothetical protein
MTRSLQSAYLPSENISVDDSLTLERSFRNQAVHTPEGSQVWKKTFELCESSTGYLWHFIVYSGAGTEITPGIDVPDQLKSSKIVVKLIEWTVIIIPNLYVYY